MNDWPVHLGWGLVGASILMFILWLVQRRTKNAGIVDVGWTFGIGALVCVLAVMVTGSPWRRLLVAGMTGLWAFRLGTYLAGRVASESEDGRYTNLREWAGPRQQPVLLFFFMLQASWVVLFSIPQYLAIRNMRPLQWIDAVGVIVFVVSIVGSSIADRQLARFRGESSNRGQVCKVGLWKYSRHPNYFFEWLHWFAYPILAIGSGSLAWVAWFGPLVMLVFLLKVTGIPPTEKRALQSRGDQYREYQRTTSAFFPWFPMEQQS